MMNSLSLILAVLPLLLLDTGGSATRAEIPKPGSTAAEAVAVSLTGVPGRAAGPSSPLGSGAPDPQDVQSVDAIVAAVYDVISGPAGEARDWDRWRSLFIPEARLIALTPAPDGSVGRRVMTPEDYVQRSGPFLTENGFFEEEIGRTQDAFGPMVHLFSAYQSKRSLEDPEPFARGINSFQLMHDGTRWWVVTILWTSEGPDLPIPLRYLGGGDPDRSGGDPHRSGG
jgi:hypothetical protein